MDARFFLENDRGWLSVDGFNNSRSQRVTNGVSLTLSTDTARISDLALFRMDDTEYFLSDRREWYHVKIADQRVSVVRSSAPAPPAAVRIGTFRKDRAAFVATGPP